MRWDLVVHATYFYISVISYDSKQISTGRYMYEYIVSTCEAYVISQNAPRDLLEWSKLPV